MRIGLFGGGFGLYGYLPAAVSLGWQVVTLERYKPFLRGRPELSPFLDRIEFHGSDTEVLLNCSRVVIARNPGQQVEFLNRNSDVLKSMQHLYLEKPLADTVDNAMRTLELICSWGTSFSVGYLFPYTDWFRALRHRCEQTGSRFSIEWAIPSIESSWKGDVYAGGGLCSFYLVHFVPTLRELGFTPSDYVTTMKSDNYLISGAASNGMRIDARLATKGFTFRVNVNDEVRPLFEAETPFGTRPRVGHPDPRLEPLRLYLTAAGSSSQIDHCRAELEVIEFRLACQRASTSQVTAQATSDPRWTRFSE